MLPELVPLLDRLGVFLLMLRSLTLESTFLLEDEGLDMEGGCFVGVSPILREDFLPLRLLPSFEEEREYPEFDTAAASPPRSDLLRDLDLGRNRAELEVINSLADSLAATPADVADALNLLAPSAVVSTRSFLTFLSFTN